MNSTLKTLDLVQILLDWLLSLELLGLMDLRENYLILS